MFAAGFTSAITAPLASALTAKGIFSKQKQKWEPKKRNYIILTSGILLVGLTFGLLNVKPVPVIIIAQAFNGLILPFISIFMLIIINNPDVMKNKINNHISNILMSIVVWITLLIGTINLLKAAQSTFAIKIENQDLVFTIIAAINLLITIFIFIKIYSFRKKKLFKFASEKE
jgi:Mn2+/Fe2+ NRAMP family transporter